MADLSSTKEHPAHPQHHLIHIESRLEESSPARYRNAFLEKVRQALVKQSTGE